MASIILKWLRRCLFICVCAFFLMSHNASALNLGTAGTYGIQCNRSHIQFNANYNTQSMYNVGNACEAVPGSDLVNYRFTGFDIYLNAAIPAHSIFNVSGQISGASINGSFNGFSGGAQFSIYQQNMTALDGTGIYFSITGITGDNALQNFNFSTGADYVGFIGSSGHFAVQPVSFVATSGDSDYSNSINGITNILNDLRTQNNDIWNMLNNLNSNTDNVNNNLGQVKGAIENLQQQQQQQVAQEKQEVQDAADEAADSGDQSAADAENATAGLISVIGGFVNAITSATPTNCKINGKINNSFNMGELDLCSMPVPSFVQIISSLILIAICIPFAIVMFNRFIGLFRSFQG